jgi:uncharacterized protein YgbK (DUF1537 family)
MPEARPRIGVVADDLTGAADTAVGFVRTGMSALVTWADQDTDGIAAGVDVLAVDSGSRALGPQPAERTTRRLVEALRSTGVRTLYKKSDSLLRGHVGIEVKVALTAWERNAVAIVAPAFPGTGRTTVGGRVLVDGTPIDRPPIATSLAAAGLSVTNLDLGDIRGAALAGTLDAHRAAGQHAIVCDAETDDDLCAIAAAGSRMGSGVVWVGSGGLASALGATLAGAAPPVVRPAAHLPGGSAVPASSGPVLVVVGSTAGVARAQVAHLAAAGVTHVTVPVTAVGSTHEPCDRQGVPGGSPVLAEVAEVMGCLRAGRDVVVTLGAEPGRSGAGDDADLAASLGQLLRPCAPLVGGLVATGGDTATGVLRAWGTTGLRLVGEVEPGVPLSYAIGPRPIPVVTKAGAFGRPSTLAGARAKLDVLLTPAEGER